MIDNHIPLYRCSIYACMQELWTTELLVWVTRDRKPLSEHISEEVFIYAFYW